jgi:hypothetical protein
MRMVFGLGGLLVTLGVIVMIMHYVEIPETQQALQQGQQMHEQVSQIGGVDDNGKPVGETVKLEPQMVGPKLASMKVTWIDPTGAMATHFGLALGDQIIATVTHGVSQKISDVNDPTMAKDNVIDAYSSSGQLIVLRGGSMAPLTLPPDTAPGSVPSVAPNNPVNNALQGAGIPTH